MVTVRENSRFFYPEQLNGKEKKQYFKEKIVLLVLNNCFYDLKQIKYRTEKPKKKINFLLAVY
jgi:hypothetical protein